MATLEELQQQLEELQQEKAEVEQDLANANADIEEMNRLREDKDAMQKKLDEAQTRLTQTEQERAADKFRQKRERALADIGLKSDDPAVQLAFPDDSVVADDIFNLRIEKLKAVADGRPKPKAADDNGDIDPAWVNFGGSPTSEGSPGDDGRADDRDWEAKKKEYRRTGDERVLARGGIRGTLKRVVQETTRGGQKLYNIVSAR